MPTFTVRILGPMGGMRLGYGGVRGRLLGIRSIIEGHVADASRGWVWWSEVMSLSFLILAVIVALIFIAMAFEAGMGFWQGIRQGWRQPLGR